MTTVSKDVTDMIFYVNVVPELRIFKDGVHRNKNKNDFTSATVWDVKFVPDSDNPPPPLLLVFC